MGEPRKIAPEETIYCWMVAAIATTCILCVAVFEASHEIHVNVVEFAGFCWLTLCVLFPVGLLVEIKQAHLRIPRPVALCLLLTGLNVCSLVKYNWREIWQFLLAHGLV